MKTRVAYPYAMVVYNGSPKLAFLTDVRDAGMAYVGHAMSRHWSKPDWSKLFKTPYYGNIKQADIIREWRNPPSVDAIKTAARAFNRRQRSAS